NAIVAISRIPARLRPAYQTDPWVVRGKLPRNSLKKKLATTASRPKRINRNTVRPVEISPVTTTTEVNGSADGGRKNVIKRIHTIAAAHSLRSKTRRSNSTNRNTNEIKSERIKLFDRSAMIVRAPRNCHCGPAYGFGGG